MVSNSWHEHYFKSARHFSLWRRLQKFGSFFPEVAFLLDSVSRDIHSRAVRLKPLDALVIVSALKQLQITKFALLFGIF
jgi:hypothetical protein